MLPLGLGSGALDGERPQRGPQQRLDRRLEEVTKAVGGGYCWLHMLWNLALAVRETVAGHRLGALEGGLARGHGVGLPLAAPIDLLPLHIPTYYGSKRFLVVSTDPLDDLSCLTTPGSAVPETRCCRCIQMHTASPCQVCQLQH